MNEFILNFGTTVHCFDERCGKLAKVAFRPENLQVTDLIVEKGFLMKQARAFPLTVVRRATNEAIGISVHEDELTGYPEFRETVVENVPEGGYVDPTIIQGSIHGLATSTPAIPLEKQRLVVGVDDNLDLLDKEMPVIAEDSIVGKVRGLAVNPENGRITEVLVNKGALFMQEFWLPAEMIARISSAGVILNVTNDELDDLIFDENLDNNWDRMPTDEKLEAVQSGQVSSKDEEEHPVNETIYNDEAALDVLIANALLADPKIEDAIIEVINDRGVITLQGMVKNNETKKAAGEVAKLFPGVVSVINELVLNPQ